MSTGVHEGSGFPRPRRVDAGEILDGALDGLDDVSDTLADLLCAELGRADATRAQRIQEAIERAADE